MNNSEIFCPNSPKNNSCETVTITYRVCIEYMHDSLCFSLFESLVAKPALDGDGREIRGRLTTEGTKYAKYFINTIRRGYGYYNRQHVAR